MEFLIVDAYYPSFLQSFYNEYPDMATRSYEAQKNALMRQSFGTSNFYSKNLQKLGYRAIELVANCKPLQYQWARENGLSIGKNGWTLCKKRGFIPWLRRNSSVDWIYTVLAAQIKDCRPDIIYFQDMNSISPAFLRDIRPYVKMIAGQIACPIIQGANFSEYDLILSSFPHFIEQFRKQGLIAEYFKLGFEPGILNAIKIGEHQGLVFVGGLSADHMERIRFLEKIKSCHGLSVWGYGVESLPLKSLLRVEHHGSAWGLDMYNILSNADIILNHHIGVSGIYANNMRLFETTGVGAFLITDYKENLHTLYEIGKELIAYRSVDECIELITYYMSHDDERKAIAAAGQRRTLSEHTYYHRMQELVEIIKTHLPIKNAAKIWQVPIDCNETTIS